MKMAQKNGPGLFRPGRVSKGSYRVLATQCWVGRRRAGSCTATRARRRVRVDFEIVHDRRARIDRNTRRHRRGWIEAGAVPATRLGGDDVAHLGLEVRLAFQLHADRALGDVPELCHVDMEMALVAVW